MIDHCISAVERNIMSLCTFHSNCYGGSHGVNGGVDKGWESAMELMAEAVAAARPEHFSFRYVDFIITCAECDYYDCFLIHGFTICMCVGERVCFHTIIIICACMYAYTHVHAYVCVCWHG